MKNEDRAVRRLSASELIDSGKFTEEDVQIIASDSSSAVRKTLIKRLSDNMGEDPYPELPENLLEEVSGSVEDASREISVSTLLHYGRHGYGIFWDHRCLKLLQFSLQDLERVPG